MADDHVPPVILGANEWDKCRRTLSEQMDDKENIGTASENGSGIPALSKGTPKTRKSRKPGGFNLRKSLAWNKAFFTEEGVLDPLELSILNEPAIKSSGKLLSGIRDGAAFPIMGSVFSSGRPDLHALEEELGNKVPTTTQTEILKDASLFSKSESSAHEDQSLLVAKQNVPLAKGICRSVPRSPAAYSFSQKRLANLHTTNPASKLPKFTKTKLDFSSAPVASRDDVLATKRNKSNQNAPPVSVDSKIHKSSSVNVKQNLSCPASSVKFSTRNSRKIMVNQTSAMPLATNLKASQTGTRARDLKLPPKPSLLTNSNNSVSHVALGKFASSHSQNSNQVCGDPPARHQAKPSGLRMPSPSCGFFCPAKISPSSLQSRRNTQPCSFSESTTQSINQSNNPKHMSELRPLHGLHLRPPPISSTATTDHTSGISVFDNTRLSTANCSITFLQTLDENSAMKPNQEQKKYEGMIGRDSHYSESSNFSTNGQKLHSDCLMVDESTDKKFEEQALEVSKPDETKQAPYLDDPTLPKAINTLPADSGFSEEYLEINALKNVDSMDFSAREHSGDSLSHIHFIPKICSPKELQTCCSEVDKPSVHTHTEDRADAYTTTSSGNKSADLDLASGLRFRHAINYNGPSNIPKEESSLRLSRKQMVGGETKKCSEVPYSSTENLHSVTKNDIVANVDDAVRLEKEGLMDSSKQVSVPVKYPLKAVPFSEEWVASLEAFGEDILEMKTGAVQNSPPEKVLLEPSPWSPVKRNVELGPYDCTKCTKNLSTSSSSESLR